MHRRKICVITGSRAEYGLLHWIMKEIQQDPALELQLVAAGMHLSPEFGLTYKTIEQDGFAIDSQVEMLLSSDTSVGVTKSIGLGVISFADALERLKPKIVVLLGDRFEILAAATAAMVARIPLAHISGGEVTEGAIDDSIRHAITKMATYHFPATEAYRERIIRMGEQPERVLNFGDPGLDSIARLPLWSREVLQKELNFPIDRPTFLVTYHPATLGSIEPERALQELFTALDQFPAAKVIFTKPNADAGGRALAGMIDKYGRARCERTLVVTSLGSLGYLSAMKHCDLVIGNSSSGIVEAPALKKGTVNIGERQNGRLKAKSVIDCPEESEAIVSAIKQGLSSEFQREVTKTESLYGNCDASRRIVAFLKEVDLSQPKRFYDCNDRVAGVASIRVGGEFEIGPNALRAKVASTVPSPPALHAMYLNTGRSAILVALEDILRRGGRKIAFVPAYCCDSVLSPFQLLGFKLRFYSVGEDLASPTGLPDEFEGTTFLYIHYFGIRNTALTQWVKRARSQGSFFAIEDCVQASLSAGVGCEGDYVVTSLRKLAHQPDGALLGSKTPLQYSGVQDPDETFVSQKLVGKMLRSENSGEELFLSLFQNSERRLEESCTPRRMSWVSSYLMARTDFSEVASARRRNWITFDRQLQQTGMTVDLLQPLFTGIRDGEVPLGYPVKVRHGLRDQLQAFLQQHNIFCPIHWPLGPEQERSGCEGDSALSRSILTFAVDQRLDGLALEYVADRIRQFAVTL